MIYVAILSKPNYALAFAAASKCRAESIMALNTRQARIFISSLNVGISGMSVAGEKRAGM